MGDSVKFLDFCAEHVQDLLELLSDGVVYRLLDGTIVAANSAMAALTGYSAAELQGMNISQILSPESFELVMERQQLLLKDEAPSERYEITFISRDGAKRFGESVSRLVAEGGQPLGILAIVRDITERRQAEARLRESEARYHALVASTSQAGEGLAVVQDRDGVEGAYVYVNEEFARISGYSREELTGGMGFRDIVAPRLLRMATRKYRLIQAGKPVSARYECAYVARDGREVPVEISAALAPYQGEQANIVYARDITQRKRAEQALRESENRYRSLIELAPDAIYIRHDDRIVFINAAGARLLGAATSRELIGKSVMDFIHPDCREIARKRARQVEETGKPIPLLEEKFIRLDGTVIDVEVAGGPITYQSRPAVQVIVRDITERKRAEQQLRESEERLSSMLDGMLESCHIISFDWRCIYLNEAAVGVWRRAREEVLGHTVTEVYPGIEKTELFAVMRRCMEGRISQRFETEFAFPDGAHGWFEASIQPVPEGISMLCLDITERKRRQQTMEFYVAQVTRVQEEERKRLARELHDETAQALALLMFDVERLIRAEGRLSDQAIVSLEHLRDKVGRIAQEVSRLSHALRPGVLDQMGLVQAVKVLAGELRQVSQIAARVRVMGHERRLPSEVEVGLFRIIQEALNNVRRHSGAARADIRIAFGLDKVRVTVADNGKGFELPERLADLAIKGDLGLIGMQERSQLLKGNFSVKSEVGQGTTVSVEVGVGS